MTRLIRTVTDVDELDGLLATRLRETLDGQGLRREDLARGMAELGFRWTRNTTSQVITGRRGLSLLEVAGICEALETPVLELLGSDGQVSLPNGKPVTVTQIAEALSGGGGDWKLRAAVRTLFRQDLDEATAKAALRLGVEPAEVDQAAMHLWRRPLAVERDHRINTDDIDANSPDGRRTVQARRGHATRVLIDELRAYLAEKERQ